MRKEPVMKKAIVGLLAVGAVIGLRQVMPRVGRKMREHCEQMMGQFAGRSETTGPEAMHQKMREHCEQMAAQREERSEGVAAA
jgi:low affinity Fe/Cu permease